MAVAEIIELPFGSQQKYDEVIKDVGLAGAQLAPGQLVHFAGPMDGGGWRIINVWESQEASDRWEEVLRPARLRAGLPESVPPQHAYQVHRLAK